MRPSKQKPDRRRKTFLKNFRQNLSSAEIATLFKTRSAASLLALNLNPRVLRAKGISLDDLEAKFRLDDLIKGGVGEELLLQKKTSMGILLQRYSIGHLLRTGISPKTMHSFGIPLRFLLIKKVPLQTVVSLSSASSPKRILEELCGTTDDLLLRKRALEMGLTLAKIEAAQKKK